MVEWISGVMDSAGYLGVVLLMFLENIFPPIPSELVMPLAGFAAYRGEMSLIGVTLAGTAGSVLGAVALYYLGKILGQQRVKRLADRYGTWLTLSGSDIEKAMRWFDRWGRTAVLLCRLVPGVRSLISIPAGVCHMNLPRFLLYTALGSGVWAAALAYLGRLLGKNYHKVDTYLGPVSYLVVATLLGSFVAWVIKRKRQQAKAQRQA